LLPRALRVSSYDGVRIVGATVIQSDETLGSVITELEAEETSSPVYVHMGASNVTFEGLTVRGYTAATESIVRITGSARRNIKLKNSTFDECRNVPPVMVTGSVPGVEIDGLDATQTGPAIAHAVSFSYQPENLGCTIRNISTIGYTNAASIGAVGAGLLPGMDAGLLQRWTVADSSGGATAAPQEAYSAGWAEGVQDLGAGEGVKYSYKFRFNGSATVWEGAYCASYKTSGGDTDTGTAHVVATRAHGDAGTGATPRWATWSNGHLLPWVDAAYDLGSASTRVRHAYFVDATAAVPTFADNAAAIAGGITAGRVYQTPTGELRIVV
jgi:hypothetical protein